jgi:hypothetical protein
LSKKYANAGRDALMCEVIDFIETIRGRGLLR